MDWLSQLDCTLRRMKTGLNPGCNGLAFAVVGLHIKKDESLNPCCNGLAFAEMNPEYGVERVVLILVVMDWLSQQGYIVYADLRGLNPCCNGLAFADEILSK